ncbi:hypothetical protein [Actinoplanes sp. NPDC049599]|uniref:hypothetical protein n=1 Tax=Actinoplanes sp. NPDC049599 TaxID=3363903 RepID=UPI0037A43C9A
MSKEQVVFAIITGVIALAGLAWTIVWALRSWRHSGPIIALRLGVGYVYDQQDQLNVTFPNGATRVMRINKAHPDPKPSRRRRGASKLNPRDNTKQPVNAVFVQNRGRAAVTIRRCEYLSPMGGAGLQFEPQPAASQWGDLLPKRLEPGDEAILVHERTQMKGFLNGVMRDHGVKQTLLLAVVTMGNGYEISTNTPLVVRADMTDTAFAEFEPNFTKEAGEEPIDAFLDVSPKRRMPWRRKPKQTLIARNYAED